MKVQTTTNHPSEWEHIVFPTFVRGTKVLFVPDRESGDDYFRDWKTCEIDGRETFVPLSFVKDEKLTRDYNPTELIAKKGDVLEVIEIVNAWLLCKDKNGVIGWLPAEIVVSI
ncbi:MAG: SH3 domain-containing protein [Firmicutes bacterium]|nr:SH3 domain-containing protein [Bacillota bacterium]